MSALPERFTARYRILDQLGEGAMGVVYRAQDLLRERAECALKVLKPPQNDADAARRLFRSEFHAMAWLNHPNTVQVFEYGELPDGTVFIVMELVPGQSLTELIGGKPMPLAAFYPLLIQVLHALDYIHARRYLHRDIKALNMRVRPDGVLKLMDFGLMARVGQAPREGLCGTLHYMAPELLRDEGAWSIATDLYALGCLAYEMLTGRLPFSGDGSAVARAHLEATPPPLGLARPDAPAALIVLVERLLAKDPTRRQDGAGAVLRELAAITGLALVQETRDQQLSFLESSGLVGRDVELAQLDEGLRQALCGQGRALLIGAPAGLGKTRLLQELELRAQLSGFVVLRARCLGEGQPALEPLRVALRPALAHGAQALRERHHPAIGTLFPELAAGSAPSPAATEALTAWLAELSTTHPLLLVLDDLHQADVQTLEAFNAAVRGLRDRCVLCVGAYPDDETPPHSPLWRSLEEGLSQPLRLTPLDRAGQAAMLAAMLPGTHVPEAFAEALYRATGGSPLFIREALKALVEEGHLTRHAGGWRFPTDLIAMGDLERVETVLRRRLGHLGPEARELLEAAAVLGHQWTLATLAAVAEADEDRLFAGLVDLTARQLLCLAEDGRYGFPHDRVREVVYEDLPRDTRADLHRRAGERLKLEHAGNLRAVASELARHFLAAGEETQALPHLLLAAEHALASGTTAVGLEHLQAAEAVLARLGGDQLEPRLELWLRMALPGIKVAPALASQMLMHALGAHEADPGRLALLLADRGLRLADLEVLHAISQGTLGEAEEVSAVVERLAGRLPMNDPPAAALVEACRYLPLIQAGRITEAVESARRAGEVLSGRRAPVAAAVQDLTRSVAAAASHAIAFQGLRPAATPGLEAGEPEAVAPRVSLGVWAAWSGHPEEAEAFIERSLGATRHQGAPPSVWVLYVRPYLRWQLGEWRPALEQLDRSLIAHPQWREQALPCDLALVLRGQLLADLGRLGEAQSTLVELVERARSRARGLVLMHALCSLGHTLIAGDRLAEAGFVYLTARDMARNGPLENPLIEAWASLGLGRCAGILGDRRGLAQIEEAIAIATRPALDNRWLQAQAQRVRGQALAALGEAGPAAQAYVAAASLFRQMGNAHWQHVVEQERTALERPGGSPGEGQQARFGRLT